MNDKVICRLCGREFKERKNLSIHVRIHKITCKDWEENKEKEIQRSF